jgi:hypothetical protein
LGSTDVPGIDPRADRAPSASRSPGYNPLVDPRPWPIMTEPTSGRNSRAGLIHRWFIITVGGCRRTPDTTAAKGPARKMRVLPEFPEKAAAEAGYSSAQYQGVVHLRQQSAEGTAVIADGFGPQATA